MIKRTLIFLLIFYFTSSTIVYSNNDVEITDNYNILLQEYIQRIESLELENQQLKDANSFLQKMIKNGFAEKIPVLTYHHLYDGDLQKSVFKNTNTVISLEAFEDQMNYLYENDYYTATLEELEMFIKGEINLPKKTVVITFDDGYKSNTELGYPVLKKYQFKATIFVIGEYIGTNGWFSYVSIEDMENTSDVFQFENHTSKMHHMVNGKALMVSSTKEKIKKDLLYLHELLGTRYFAYPYGIYNQTAIESLKETNHSMAFTTKYGYVTKKSKPYELTRFGISPKTTLQEFKNIVNVK